MGKDKSLKSPDQPSRKKLQQQIMDTLVSSLGGLKDILGEKKFASRAKKAAKLLSGGIKKAAPKKIKAPKKKKGSTGMDA